MDSNFNPLKAINDCLYTANYLTDYLEEARNKGYTDSKVQQFIIEGTNVPVDGVALLQDRLPQLKKYIESLQDNAENKSLGNLSHKPQLMPEDLEGLPAELLNALNINDSDKQEFQIIEAMNLVGGTASIDKIMVAYYRRYEEILDRSKLMTKLYRMVKKDLVKTDPNRKGVYSVIGTNDQKEGL